MKIQIVNNDNESIDGFIALKISDNIKQDLGKIVDNSCTELLVLDVINSFKYNESIEFLLTLLKKVRINGNILLKGVSSLSLSNAILNELINSEEGSSVIENIKSIHDHRDIVNLLEANNFTVNTIMLGGVSYELGATRSKNVS